jgi:uncharacterized membrane protein
LSNKNNNRKLQNNSRNSIPRSARSGSRDLLLATIGVLGCLLSLGLLWSNLWQESLPYCSAQSGCNLVQSSKWSHFLGMPLTFFGALLYMGIAFSALRIIDKKKTVNLATIFSTTGFLISAYLMVIAQYVILFLLLHFFFTDNASFFESKFFFRERT